MADSPFTARIATLTDADKNRIVCAVLHGSLNNIDWSAAATAFGSASAASMQKCYQNAMKKIGTGDASGTDAAAHTNNSTADKGSEQATKKAKGGRKRKAAAVAEGSDDGEKKVKVKTEEGLDDGDLA